MAQIIRGTGVRGTQEWLNVVPGSYVAIHAYGIPVLGSIQLKFSRANTKKAILHLGTRHHNFILRYKTNDKEQFKYWAPPGDPLFIGEADPE